MMVFLKRTLSKWILFIATCFLVLYGISRVNYSDETIERTISNNSRLKFDIPRVHRKGDELRNKFERFQCSETKSVDHNKADIQVSSLVEKLDFHLDHGGHEESSFPNLKPLPFSEKLRIFLIPHSHCDPGWLETYVQYYETKVRFILTWLYIFAIEHEDFKYIYAEVSFFKLWWEEQEDDIKEDMRRLAREGRFEFVQGGWVQNDEANTHYFAMFNQMLDGHYWLKDNFPEAIPKSGWAIDPFGLSPMMAYVNKLFGLQGMHIQRVHYTLKNHLAETRNLDFRWRQSWDSEGDTDMLTHLGPFVSYGQQHSCGPDPEVCCMFNFMEIRGLTSDQSMDCPGSPKNVLVTTTPGNVKQRALKILEQWRLKAALHSTNTIFVELGNDFTYALKEHAHGIYDNYTPIMEYINKEPSLNTHVTWGVLSEYFGHVTQHHGADKLPSLSGDFFTYSDRNEDYWSGYYTSRPFYKNLDRVLESALRRTEILFSFYRSDLVVGELIAARHTLSLFQHHDGVTGTAKNHVVNDYGARLFRAYKISRKLTFMTVRHILKDKTRFEEISDRLAFNSIEKLNIIPGESVLLLVNTLPRDLAVTQVLAVANNQTLAVYGEGDEKLLQQIEPHIEYGEVNYDSRFISFRASIPSVTIQTFKLARTSERSNHVTIDSYNYELGPQYQEDFYSRIITDRACDDIVLGKEKVNIVLDCRTGLMKSMTQDGLTISVQQELLLYNSTGGAYLFNPVGEPEQLVGAQSRPRIVVMKGPVRARAVVSFNSTLVISYLINMDPGVEGDYVELELLTKIRKLEGDLVLRFKTGVESGDSIYTDLNGHTIQQHRFKDKLKIQGNFFPMPSTAFIQDGRKRFTILGSEPHGVASLQAGHIEVVLDRRGFLDDERGLGYGVSDNLPTPAKLRLILESTALLTSLNTDYMVEYPSLLSHQLQQSLSHPVFMGTKPWGVNSPQPRHVQLMRSLPCDTELVNLRFIKEDISMLITRKLGFSCRMRYHNLCEDQYQDLENIFKDKVTIESQPMSPFDGNKKTDKSSNAMEFSSFYVNFMTNDLYN